MNVVDNLPTVFVLCIISMAILSVVAKHYERKRPTFEEFLQISEGRCRHCGCYSPENVKEDGYWIQLTCRHCNKTSAAHLKS